MKTSILDMESYTYAVKAQRLLSSHGIACRVKRREKNAERGCGYSLHIFGSFPIAAKLLDNQLIPYSLVSGGGEADDKL